MKWGALLWGLGSMAAGLAIGSGRVLAGTSTGPRLGMASLLCVLGLAILLAGMIPWLMRRQAAAEAGGGTCPVGATCSCGHFNFKPRRSCKQCGQAVAYP